MGNNKLPDVFGVMELVKIFDAIDRPKVGIAVGLAFFCGLRISEVCNLRIEDIDLENNRLKVVDGKNSRRSLSGYGKDRYVVIPSQLISPIKKWIEILEGGKWLLPSDKSPDMHIRKKSLHEQFREVLKRAGLLIPSYEIEYETKINGKKTFRKVTRHKYYFHTLRHAYATYLRDKGVDIYTISDLLGHNQVTTTQIYARISDGQRKKAVEDAFRNPLQNQILKPKINPMQINSMKPIEYLQMQMLKGEITQQEYVQKLALLNSEGIKKVIEMKD